VVNGTIGRTNLPRKAENQEEEYDSMTLANHILTIRYTEVLHSIH